MTAALSFDPFNDRKSRDIRNRLSEAFVSSLRKQNPEILRQEARVVKAAEGMAREAVYREYIQDRLTRYQRVLDQSKNLFPDDPNRVMLLIWNAGLFFECHEYLEKYWLKAADGERTALQGLIKAAGVFVHRTLGREASARRLSPKALHLIVSSRGQLSFIRNLKDLIAALKNHGAEAPKLKGN